MIKMFDGFLRILNIFEITVGTEDHDLFMAGRQNILAHGNQFFVEFFTIPQTDINNFNIHIRFFPRKANQVPRHIVDFDRRTHSQNKDFAALPHCAGLQDHLRSFGDRHEETIHFRMRNGHRTALLDLTTEKGDDGPGRTDHVAKSHGHKLGAVSLLALHNQFRHPLAGAHHIGRTNRFIR